MDYLIDWLIPNKIIYMYWPENVTLEMMTEVNAKVIQMIDEAEEQTTKTHLLLDARDIKDIPVNLFTMRKTMDVYDHPNCGWSWTLSNSSMITFLGSSIPQMVTHVRFRVFSEVDEMLDFIEGINADFTPENMNLELLQRPVG